MYYHKYCTLLSSAPDYLKNINLSEWRYTSPIFKTGTVRKGYTFSASTLEREIVLDSIFMI